MEAEKYAPLPRVTGKLPAVRADELSLRLETSLLKQVSELHVRASVEP